MKTISNKTMKPNYQKYLPLLFLFSINYSLFAQKRPLDITETARNWASAGNPVIANDGNYFSYTISNQPAGSKTLVIKAANNNWQQKFIGLENVTFSDNSRKAIFMMGDSLCLLTLGTQSSEHIPGVAYYQLLKQGKTEWLVIQKSNANQELVVRNMQTGKEVSYSGVSEFVLSPTGNAILLNKLEKLETGMQTSLYWLSMPDLKIVRVIETPDQLGDFTFDQNGSQIAFISFKTSGTYDDVSFSKGMSDDISISQITKKPLRANTIMRYQPGMNGAQVWVDDQTPGIDVGLKVGEGNLYFSKDGTRLFFKLAKIPVILKVLEKPVLVEVWNYKDAFLQSEQQKPMIVLQPRPGLNDDYVAVVNKGASKILRLQQERDFGDYSKGNDYIIFNTYKEAPYNPENNYFRGEPLPYLVSAIDGSRKRLPGSCNALSGSSSLTGKYLLYFDPDKQHFFTYEIKTGQVRNITARIPFPVYYEDADIGSKAGQSDHSPVWLKNDEVILIGDTYDIWQVDPTGIKAPVNLTNGYGRKHGITLRYIMAFGKSPVPYAGQDLLIGGFNQGNKDGGYFSKKLGTKGDPILLSMGPYVYGGVSSNLQFSVLLNPDLEKPIKARDADVFIFRRQSEKEFPNLFLTKDFNQLTTLTDFQSQKEINWHTTELVTWKKFDGQLSQGILFKPENFDSTKKHPLIIWYYEKNSSALHGFLKPGPSAGDLNIPYFVSNGYLVFVPDISYKIGATGESAYNSVVSGAQYLAQRSYVDTKKIGVTGHSFGGYQTNYIVTRTSMFAAALAANGPTNLISNYGSLDGQGGDRIGFTENKQFRMGTSLSENPEAYISNSPIFKADKVTTPLLLMHTKLDGAVGWSQAVEFFTTLRRLNKKVWLLQYDNEGHSLSKPNNQKDFTIRMKQFFDHYLKDAPEPVWMSRGIPAKMKGIDDGLRLDITSVTPDPGLIQEKKAGN